MNVKILSEESVDKITFLPDLLILTVKSYDTYSAISQAKQLIDDNIVVLSLQNGLDNIDKIEKIVDRRQLIVGVTTYGAFFSEPGVVKHTGKGQTLLGELNGRRTKRIKNIADLFNKASIDTIISEDIIKEIWTKAIINSSINPLTTVFQCKNGYLLENPILEKIVEKICKESTSIARANGISLLHQYTIKKTREVIKSTSENYSSMLQSFKKGKKTEIKSINGKLIDIGKMRGVNTSMNSILVYLVNFMAD